MRACALINTYNSLVVSLLEATLKQRNISATIMPTNKNYVHNEIKSRYNVEIQCFLLSLGSVSFLET
jgi:hypothetical protein